MSNEWKIDALSEEGINARDYGVVVLTDDDFDEEGMIYQIDGDEDVYMVVICVDSRVQIKLNCPNLETIVVIESLRAKIETTRKVGRLLCYTVVGDEYGDYCLRMSMKHVITEYADLVNENICPVWIQDMRFDKKEDWLKHPEIEFYKTVNLRNHFIQYYDMEGNYLCEC